MLYNKSWASRPATRVVVAPSDDEVKRFFSRFQPILHDGPVPVRGRVIGWKRTAAGGLAAIILNEVSGRRALWCLDFATRRPRHLAVLA